MEERFDVDGKGFSIRHSTKHHLGHELDGSCSVANSSAFGSAALPADRLTGQQLLEKGVLDLLTDYQLANMDATNVLCCRAMYTFKMDLQELHSAAWNDYGQGNLQRVRVSKVGREISPLPAWLENGVGLQVFLQKKVATNQPHSSGDNSKRGFEIPWRARIHLQRVPDGCSLTEVQLAFINPDNCGSPIVHINLQRTHATNMRRINSVLENINGQTYSECCQELGIFREAYCFVTMRVPLRRFLGQLLCEFRHSIPDCPDQVHGVVGNGADIVVLKMRHGVVKTDREILASVSPTARTIFAGEDQGKVSLYFLDYSKAAVVTVLGAAVHKHQSLLVDPLRADPFFLYEVMQLALSWEIPELKLWTQVAFLERLCHPIARLQQVPVLDAVRIIRDHAYRQTFSRMVLCGLVSVLRILRSPAAPWTPGELQQLIAPASALWKSVIQPTRLVPDTHILVKTLLNGTLTVAVNLADWVYQVKCRIQDMRGIPSDQQRLIFVGRQLEDNAALTDHGVTPGATLHLVLRLRGC